jgi:hypothetical protein
MIQRRREQRRTSVRNVIVATLLVVGGVSFVGASLFSSSASAATPAYNLDGSWSLVIHNCQGAVKPHAITVTNFSQSSGDFQVNYVDDGVPESFIGVESGTSVNLDGHVPNGTVAQSGTDLIINGSRACSNGTTYSYSITNTAPDLSATATTTTSPGTTTTTVAPGTDIGGIDVAAYCTKTTGGGDTLAKGAIDGPNYAYNNWECASSGTPLNMQQVCSQEYGAAYGNVVAKTDNPNSANGWNCYTSSAASFASSLKKSKGNTSTDFVSLKTDVPPVASKLGTPSEIFHSPGHDIANAVITVGVVLFITFPANIFNQTFSENYEEIVLIFGNWRRRLRRLFGLSAPRRAAPTAPAVEASTDTTGAASASVVVALVPEPSVPTAQEQNSPDRVTLAGFLAVLVIGSIFGGLLDPRFGMNRQSLVSFGATLLAFTWGAMLSWLIARAFRRHHQYPTETYWRALPIGLGVAIICVLISRLSHFQPGYLYGVVVSVAFVGTLKDRHNAHLITISTISTLSVAFLAWLAWIPFNHLALEHGSNFLYGIIDDVLASIFIGGLVGTVVGLIPLRGLPGEHLSKWRKDVWALIFFISMFLLIEVELRPASGPTHTGAAPVVTIIVLFLFFGGSTFAMRAYFAKRKSLKEDVPVSQSVTAAPDVDEHS